MAQSQPRGLSGIQGLRLWANAAVCHMLPRLSPLVGHNSGNLLRWLNIAEIELNVLTKQCLDRRIAAIETLRQETKAWAHERNVKQTGVDWQSTTEDARIRLKRLYPQYQS